jgi:hypothetical protein
VLRTAESKEKSGYIKIVTKPFLPPFSKSYLFTIAFVNNLVAPARKYIDGNLKKVLYLAPKQKK